MSAGSVRAFFLHTSNKVTVAGHTGDDPLSSDENLKLFNSATKYNDPTPFSTVRPGYSW